MNCERVIAEMGFSCRSAGEDVLRIWSPFTYGNDGDVIGLYVEKIPTGYRITDNCEALMHASSMGIVLTDAKLNAVRRNACNPVHISQGGEIVAYVAEEDVGKAVAHVLNASLAVSHFETSWQPRVKSDSFTHTVGRVLQRAFGAALLRNVTATGASGHQLELPLAVKGPQSLIYVQPIPTDAENRIDWKNVYAGFGRMTDLKQAGAEVASRIVVLEDSSNDAEMKSAMMLLAESANVVQFTNLTSWANDQKFRLAA